MYKNDFFNLQFSTKAIIMTYLKLALLADPFLERLSRKASSLLPVVSYELLVVLLFCVMPFVRLPLRCERCSMLLLLLLLLFDCPPLIGDAILLFIESAAITEKFSPQPLSSSEFGVVLELKV